MAADSRVGRSARRRSRRNHTIESRLITPSIPVIGRVCNAPTRRASPTSHAGSTLRKPYKGCAVGTSRARWPAGRDRSAQIVAHARSSARTRPLLNCCGVMRNTARRTGDNRSPESVDGRRCQRGQVCTRPPQHGRRRRRCASGGHRVRRPRRAADRRVPARALPAHRGVVGAVPRTPRCGIRRETRCGSSATTTAATAPRDPHRRPPTPSTSSRRPRRRAADRRAAGTGCAGGSFDGRHDRVGVPAGAPGGRRDTGGGDGADQRGRGGAHRLRTRPLPAPPGRRDARAHRPRRARDAGGVAADRSTCLHADHPASPDSAPAERIPQWSRWRPR